MGSPNLTAADAGDAEGSEATEAAEAVADHAVVAVDAAVVAAVFGERARIRELPVPSRAPLLLLML